MMYIYAIRQLDIDMCIGFRYNKQQLQMEKKIDATYITLQSIQ